MTTYAHLSDEGELRRCVSSEQRTNSTVHLMGCRQSNHNSLRRVAVRNNYSTSKQDGNAGQQLLHMLGCSIGSGRMFLMDSSTSNSGWYPHFTRIQKTSNTRHKVVMLGTIALQKMEVQSHVEHLMYETIDSQFPRNSD